MDIDAAIAERALEAAFQKYPQFREFGPRLVARPLFRGVAYQLEWETTPSPELTDAWEFQNAAVKGYKRLIGSPA